MKVTMHTAMLCFIASTLFLCTSCEGFESILATVKWDKTRDMFHITLRVENVDASFFDCDDDGKQCAEKIEEALKSSDMLDLGDQGVTVLSQTLAMRGAKTDVLIETRGPITAQLTKDLGVGIEEYGKPGREKSRWVILPNETFLPIDLPKGAQHRLTPVWSNHTREIREEWVLPRNAKQVVLRMGPDESSDEKIKPLFSTFPELESTLKKRGILL